MFDNLILIFGIASPEDVDDVTKLDVILFCFDCSEFVLLLLFDVEFRTTDVVFGLTTQLPVDVAFIISLMSLLKPLMLDVLLVKLDDDPELHVDKLSSLLCAEFDEFDDVDDEIACAGYLFGDG